MSRHIINKSVGEELILNIPEPLAQKVKLVTEPFLFSDETVYKIKAVFEQEMKYGLMRNPPKKSCLQMANTFIPHLLTGQEKGNFLALDLGGTQFRVLMVKLQEGSDMKCILNHYEVPDDLRDGEGEALFDFLANCIYDFLDKNKLMGQSYQLGFCFSFPMDQTGIDEGILLTWTKSFTTRNVEGTEVVQKLKNSLKKHTNINVDVIAIVNDAPATLVAGSEIDKKTAIGLILGTGCNASYFEKVSNILKWEGAHPGVDEVIIDIEWGAFGDTGELDFIKTKYDKVVDENSLIPKSFTFEKLLAGKFIGPLTKEVLLTLIEMKVIFEESNVAPVDWELTAGEISDIVASKSSLRTIQEMFLTKGFTKVSLLDSEIIRYVATVVSVRGSLLVSVCLASLIRRMDKPDITIAVDGSLFKHHPKYKIYMESFITALARDYTFRLILAEDGSGIGAGLLAAIISGIENRAVLHA